MYSRYQLGRFPLDIARIDREIKAYITKQDSKGMESSGKLEI